MADADEAAESTAATATAATDAGLESALAAFAADQGIQPGSDAPAAQDTPAESPAEGGDYNEEDHVEEVPAEEPKPEPVAATDGEQWPDDVRKTWDQYPSERERAKALAENKRYAIEQAAEAKRLKAELEALKAGKPAAVDAPTPTTETAPPAPPTTMATREEPTAEDVRTTIQRLAQQDPSVQRAVESLGHQRNTIVTRTTQRAELVKKLGENKSALAKLDVLIEYLEEESKGRPDDFEIREKLEQRLNQRRDLRADINESSIEERNLRGEIAELENDYRYGLTSLQEVGVGEHRRTREQEESSRTANERQEAERTLWKKSFADLATEIKIPEALREDAEQILLARAAVHPGDIGDLPAWLRKNAGLVTGMLERHRTAVLAEYGDSKRADAEQPAPKGPAAVARVEPERPMSSREADRIASASLRRALGGA